MLQPGSITVFNDHGRPKVAIVTGTHDNGLVDLHVLEATHRLVSRSPDGAENCAADSMMEVEKLDVVTDADIKAAGLDADTSKKTHGKKHDKAGPYSGT